VSRFGLDYALDTMGVVHGGTVSCNYTTYFDGSGNFNIDFVDDGGELVPETGATRLSGNNSYIVNILASPYIFNSQDRLITWDIDVKADNAFGAEVVYYDRVAGGGGQKIGLETRGQASGNYLQGAIIDDNGATVVNFGVIVPAVMLGRHKLQLEYILSTNTYNIYYDDGLVDTAVGLTTADITFDRRTLGSRLTTLDHCIMDVYGIIDEFGFTANFDTRYRQNPDLYFGKIVDSDGKLWEVHDDSSTYSIFKYDTKILNYTGVADTVYGVGDSITAGSGATANNGYYDQIEEMSDFVDLSQVTWVNGGIGGFDSFDLAPDAGTPSNFVWGDYTNGKANSTGNITDVIATNPTVIIWFVSQNDNFRGYELSESEAVLDAVIVDCAAAGIPLIIATAMPRLSTQPAEAAWANSFSTIVESKGVAYFDPNTIIGLGGATHY